MQIDQERLEALKPQLEQHGVRTDELPEPGTPAWDASVKHLSLHDPLLAQEFAALAYDPDELANSELVERQASRAAARRGPLASVTSLFRTTTVNGDVVPHTSLVRNLLIGAGVLAAVGFYVLVPSETGNAAAGQAGSEAPADIPQNPAGAEEDVPGPQDTGTGLPSDAALTSGATPTASLSPSSPGSDVPVSDPTGMGEPVSTPPDTMGMTPEPTPIGTSDTPVYVQPASYPPATTPRSAAPQAPAPVVVRDPGAAGVPVVQAPTLVRTGSGQRGEGTAPTLVRTASTAGGSTAAGQATRGLTGTGGTGQAEGEGSGGEAKQGGRGLTSTATGTRGSTPGLSSAQAAATGAAGSGVTTGGTGLRSSGAAQPAAPAYGLSSSARGTQGAGAQGAGTPPSADGAGRAEATGSAAAQPTSGVGLHSVMSAAPAGAAPSATTGTARAYGLASSASARAGTATGATEVADARSSAATTAAAPKVPYAVGRPVQARFTLGVGVVEGADQNASLPVYAESPDGAVWRGYGVLDGRGRIRVTFDAVLQDGVEYPLVADAYGTDGQPGVPANVRLTTPNLAATLLSGLAGGVKAFSEAMVNQRQVSVQPGAGGNVVTNNSANTPNFWLMTASSALGSVSIPQGKGGMINVAEVQAGAALQIVVRRLTRGE